MLEQEKTDSLNDESSSSLYFFEDNNLLHIINKSTSLHTEANALENVEMYKKMIGDQPRMLLIDVTEIKSMTTRF